MTVSVAAVSQKITQLYYPCLVSYFGVPGTATIKQDGRTGIGMPGQVLR